MCLVIVNDIGKQADNGQRTENDFSCVHLFTSSTVREIFNGLDNQIDHRANGLEDWTERNHKQHLLSLIRVEQFSGHFVQQSRIIQHFLDFFLGAAVIQECLHLISRDTEGFCNAE